MEYTQNQKRNFGCLKEQKNLIKNFIEVTFEKRVLALELYIMIYILNLFYNFMEKLGVNYSDNLSNDLFCIFTRSIIQ